MLRGIPLIYWVGWIGLNPRLVFGRNAGKKILAEKDFIKSYVLEIEEPPLTLEGLKTRILTISSVAGPFLEFAVVILAIGGLSSFATPPSWRAFDWAMVFLWYFLSCAFVNSGRGVIAMSDFYRFKTRGNLDAKYRINPLAHPQSIDLAMGLIGPMLCFLIIFGH